MATLFEKLQIIISIVFYEGAFCHSYYFALCKFFASVSNLLEIISYVALIQEVNPGTA